MLQPWIIVCAAFGYLCLLFAIAYWADKRADTGPQHRHQPVYLRAVDRRLLHGVDVLRQRRPRGGIAASTSCRSIWGRRWSRAVVAPDAQDPAHQQGQPHHLDRRLRRLALRQEPAARRPRHHHRRDRHHAVHRAAAERRVGELQRAAALSGDRACRPTPEPDFDVPGHGALRGRADGRLRDPLRHAAHRRDRAPRRHGRGDRLRIDRQAGRLPGRRRVRDVRDVRRLRRHLQPRRTATPTSRGCSPRRRAGGYGDWITLTLLSMAAIMFLPRQFQVIRRREHQRAPSRQGGVAVPALSDRHQHLRAADRASPG